jgi:2-dehydropantoate 2-reductase
VRIAVFGAGAVGGFFGGLLARAGQDVHFIARGRQLAALQQQGLTIRSLQLGDVQIPDVRAHSRAADVGIADIVLVCVKANQTAAILDDIATLTSTATTIVTMQNGVDSDDEVADRFGRECVIPAVVYVGATVESPGIVSHVAGGTIMIGARPGVDASRLPVVRDALAASGRPVRISDDIQLERWHKLLWNASFNTVSALTGRTPRELIAHAESRALIVGIMREVIAVGRACGIALWDRDADEQLAWTEQATGIRTSMMVDRERGRAMEVEALIGVIVRAARQHGVAAPSSEAVYGLLRAIEAEPLDPVSGTWMPPPSGRT